MKRYQREIYFELLFRAEYFRWNALKGFPISRVDFQSGRPITIGDKMQREEGRIAYKALAKHALDRARKYRESCSQG